LQLETGRTHQIRVHMSDLGFPLVGDPLYGRKRRVEHIPKLRSRGVELGLNRQALHAQTLGFLHPITGQTIRFTSQVPADITSLILDLGGTEDLLSIDSRALT
ncbi:MAG: RluA family pseudouridine synthase, partial [Bradymonadia bacterium]